MQKSELQKYRWQIDHIQNDMAGRAAALTERNAVLETEKVVEPQQLHG